MPDRRILQTIHELNGLTEKEIDGKVAEKLGAAMERVGDEMQKMTLSLYQLHGDARVKGILPQMSEQLEELRDQQVIDRKRAKRERWLRRKQHKQNSEKFAGITLRLNSQDVALEELRQGQQRMRRFFAFLMGLMAGRQGEDSSKAPLMRLAAMLGAVFTVLHYVFMVITWANVKRLVLHLNAYLSHFH